MVYLYFLVFKYAIAINATVRHCDTATDDSLRPTYCQDQSSAKLNDFYEREMIIARDFFVFL